MGTRIEVGGSNYEMSGRIEVGSSNWVSTSNYSRDVVSAPNESRVGRVSAGDPGVYRAVARTPIETNMGRVRIRDENYRSPTCTYEPTRDHAFEAWLGLRPLYDLIAKPSSKAVTVRYEPEPDRDVDNDVYQRSREACGDYSRDNHRDRESSLFGKREWTDTARDAADVTQKLWEAAQMAKTGTGGVIAGGIKCYEAAEPAARVIEDLGKDAAERFVESRSDSVKGGYSEYSDIGFQ